MKILVVDDEVPARERLKRLIEEQDEWQVVSEARNGREALEQADETQPDIVLLDIRMPGMDGIETARHLAGSFDVEQTAGEYRISLFLPIEENEE